MKNVIELIKKRRSVRTYDNQIVDDETKNKLILFSNNIVNPFRIPVEFKFLNGKENGLICPVVNGTDLYVGGKIKNIENASVAFGYSFEAFILFALSCGLGTVWLGGTMNRNAFEEAMKMSEDEIMPCATPLGYIAKQMSVREKMMRKAVKSDERLPFETLFFDGSFEKPLTKEKAGILGIPLEMVRLAPSAVNKQPWRIVVIDNLVHFCLKRSKGFGKEGKLDMQEIDLGIALCHFDLAAKECQLNVEFTHENPCLSLIDMEYIGSYKIMNIN